MGIDVEIYYESTNGLEPVDLILPEGWSIRPVCDYEREFGATHSLNNLLRYYGFGYERGPWGIICGVLMQLFASPNVNRVWYFGDCSNLEDVHPIEIEDVLEISRHYMLNGERPYHRDFERIKIKE